jgi:hypothetical protein
MQTVDNEFLTAAESWSFLGISKAYFYRLKSATNLPTYGVGGANAKKTLYKKTDLLGLIKLKKASGDN